MKTGTHKQFLDEQCNGMFLTKDLKLIGWLVLFVLYIGKKWGGGGGWCLGRTRKKGLNRIYDFGHCVK